MLLAAALPLQAASPDAGSCVLVVHSYHVGLSWTDDVMNGIRDGLRQSGDEVRLSAEYLDARRFPDPETGRRIRELLIAKLEGTRPDLIVVSDNAALDFVLAERGRLFPETPIVFCGINGFTPAMMANHRRITGVAEDVSVVETIALALRLHPQTKEVIVIGRTTVAADRANRESFAAALPGLPTQLKVTFWDDLPLSELQTRLERLEEGAVVFLNGLMADGTGRQLMYGETTKWVSEHSRVPVYSLWEVYLGYGIVGGKLVSGYRQGQLAGELARRILSGESADGLPVVNARDANRYLFDYRQLERFAIPLADLPDNALFVNRPESFYTAHRAVVWATAAVVSILVGLVVLLTTAMVRRRSAERALRESEKRFRALIKNSLDVVAVYTAEGLATYLSPAVKQMLGYQPEALIGVDAFSLVHPDDLAIVRSGFRRIIEEGGLASPLEYRCRHADGSWVHLESVGGNYLDDAAIRGLVVNTRDITERKRAEAALEESESKFRDLVEKAIVGVYLIQDGVFKYVNARFAEINGYSVAEMTGKMAVGEAVYPEDRPIIGESIQKRLRGEVPTLEASFRIVTKDGEIRNVEVFSTGTLFQGRPAVIGTAVDITERKRAEEALRSSEERFRTLIESSPLPIVMARDGKFIYVNSAYCRMIGVDSAGQVIHTDLLETVAPEKREEVRGYMEARAHHEEAPAQYECLGLRMDGSSFPYEINVAQVNLADGPALIAYINDITERKRAEEALAKRLVALTQPLDAVEKIAFEDLFDLAEIQRIQDLTAEAWGVGALITRPDGSPITRPGNFTHFCSDFIRKTEKGFSKCQISDAELGRHNPSGPVIQKCLSAGLWGAGASITVGGRHIGNWLIGQVRNEAQEEGQIMAYARELGHDESEFRQAFLEVPVMSQEKFAQIAHALFALAHQLSTIAYQNIQQARFITERKRAEEEMRRLRNYLSNIIDSMPSVLVGVDTEGRVTHWNTAAELATGVGAEQAQGQPLEQVLPAMGRQLERLRQAMRTRMVEAQPKVPRLVDGEVRYEDVTVYPLMSNGVEGAVIRVDDVTERVRIEEMMVQSEKMLSVGGLAAGMAHEINNPLGVILQAVQNLFRRVSPGLPANVRAAEECGINLSGLQRYFERREVLTFLEDIRQSGQRAAEIVSNMLSFSRKAEGEGNAVDIAALLDRTVVLAGSDYDLKKHYDFRQIEIVRDYDPDVPQVVCQPGRIQQVFLNILRNGAEAMMAPEESGRAPQFTLRIGREAGMVRIEIEDNGPGMDEATRKRVFEPFFTTKPPGAGTGLGLSVSYFIITENHGGTMSVESKEGVGTRFVIGLPAAGRKP